MLTMKDKPPST